MPESFEFVTDPTYDAHKSFSLIVKKSALELTKGGPSKSKFSLTSFFRGMAWSASKGNQGDYLRLGGLFVIKSGRTSLFEHREKTPFDHPEIAGFLKIVGVDYKEPQKL